MNVRATWSLIRQRWWRWRSERAQGRNDASAQAAAPEADGPHLGPIDLRCLSCNFPFTAMTVANVLGSRGMGIKWLRDYWEYGQIEMANVPFLCPICERIFTVEIVEREGRHSLEVRRYAQRADGSSALPS